MFVGLFVFLGTQLATIFRDPKPATFGLVDLVKTELPALEPSAFDPFHNPIWAYAKFKLTNTTGKTIFLRDYGMDQSGNWRTPDYAYLEILSDSPDYTAPLAAGDSITIIRAFRESERSSLQYQESIDYQIGKTPKWMKTIRRFFNRGRISFADIEPIGRAESAKPANLIGRRRLVLQTRESY